MKCAINARLLSAAELVRQDAVLADIGTDHAYLPLFLLSEERISYAYASDVNKGPLDSAMSNARECNMTEKMSFLLTDGASALAGKGITDYAICGMGGELIADIIERAPHLKSSGINLILQPMSRQEKLRAYLARSGFEIVTESYSYDSGKYYVCLLATYTGKCREISQLESHVGGKSSNFVNKDCQKGYIEAKIASLTKAVNGKKISGKSEESDTELLCEIKQIYQTICRSPIERKQI